MTSAKWKFEKDRDNMLNTPRERKAAGVYGTITRNGWHVARVWSDFDGHEKAAAYMVQACNNYGAMLGALQKARVMLLQTDWRDDVDAMGELSAAIDAAKEE